MTEHLYLERQEMSKTGMLIYLIYWNNEVIYNMLREYREKHVEQIVDGAVRISRKGQNWVKLMHYA